jgi:hypothetical protein
MDCPTLIACIEKMSIGEIEIGTIINGVLAVINFGVLVLIYRQFKIQAKQLNEQKRQFSLQSFQSTFLGLLAITEKPQQDKLVLYSEAIRRIDHDSPDDKIDGLLLARNIYSGQQMAMVTKLLKIIEINIAKNSLSLENAKHYSGMVASHVGHDAVRDYRLICIKQFLDHKVRCLFDTADKLDFFALLSTPNTKKNLEQFDERIDRYIKNKLPTK